MYLLLQTAIDNPILDRKSFISKIWDTPIEDYLSFLNVSRLKLFYSYLCKFCYPLLLLFITNFLLEIIYYCYYLYYKKLFIKNYSFSTFIYFSHSIIFIL